MIVARSPTDYFSAGGRSAVDGERKEKKGKNSSETFSEDNGKSIARDPSESGIVLYFYFK